MTATMDFDSAGKLAMVMWNRMYASPDAPDINISYAQFRYNIACAMMGEELEHLVYTLRKKKNTVAAVKQKQYPEEAILIRKELFEKLAAIHIYPPAATRLKTLKLFLRDKGCLNCPSKNHLTRDHIIPIALGGSNGYDNLQTLCKTCNEEKADKLVQSNIDRIPELREKNKLMGLKN